MQEVITKFEQKYRKAQLPDVRSGDTVRVSQKIREAGKERTQMFEGMVIRTKRLNSLQASITVRKIASGVGVEKTYQLHSPNVEKVQIIRRSKVRRNLLSYIRERQGKATRLTEQGFDREAANVKDEPKPVKEEKAEDKTEAAAEEPSKKEKQAEAKAETKEEVTEKAETKEETKSEKKDDKAAEKKAKAEEFRKAQEAKKK